MIDIKKIAELHWEWVEPLLKPHYTPEVLATMKYLYSTAMIHGWKHREEAYLYESNEVERDIEL